MGCCCATKNASFDEETVENKQIEDIDDTSPAVPLNKSVNENTDEIDEERTLHDDENDIVPDDKDPLKDEISNPTDFEQNKATTFALLSNRPEEDMKRKKSKRHEWRTGLNFDAMKHQIVFNISDAATNETYTARLGKEELNTDITMDEYNKMGEVMGTGHRQYSETDDGHCKVILSKGDIVYEFIAQCNS